MIRVFAFVTLTSLKNRVMSGMKRLREPRYLISAIFGLAYLWFFSFRHLTRSGPGSKQFVVITSIGADLASIVVLVLMIGAWALPGDKGGLEFSEAEIQFLFPAPLSRRQLLLYKIIRMQVPALISSTMLAIVGFRRANFVGFWLAFGVLSIYFVLAALGRARLRLAGVGFFVRVIAVIAIFTALSWFFTVQFGASGMGAALRKSRPADPARAAATLDRPFQRPAVKAVLFVPHVFGGAAFARSAPQFLAYGSGVAALGVLFFFLATRLNISFEEASIVASQARLERKQRMRGRQEGRAVTFKRLPPPFTLRPRHGPVMAIFWKNSIAALRISAAWIILAATPFMVLSLKTIAGSERFFSEGTAVISLFMCGMIPLIAPDIFRQDLRFDLAHADLLKSYPISGQNLVLAEMAAPVIIVAALELILLTLSSIVLNFSHVAGRLLTFFASPSFIVVALMFAIPVCGAQLLIRNAIAVFFPAWAVRSKEDVRGFVAIGQRLVVLFGNLVVLAALLVPAAILFVPAYFLAHHYFSDSASVLAIATAPSAALLVAEVWFGIHLVGQQFDRLDASNEIQM